MGEPHELIDRRWSRIGRNAAYVAGAAFVVGTVLFLLDAANLLGESPQYQVTSAGPIQDEANFWVAYFEHQHGILWDIIGRDLILPVGFLALIVVGLAIRHLVGNERPEGQLMVAFLVVGGTISIIADLVFLGDVEYWRLTGWTADPPEIAVSFGRASEAIDFLTRWLEAAGFAILAVGVLYLGLACRRRPELPRSVEVLAYTEALLLVGIAFAGAGKSDTSYQMLSLLTGVLIAPVLTVVLGKHLGRLARRSTFSDEEPRRSSSDSPQPGV